MRKHKEYQLYDLYDCYGIVGEYDTLDELERAADEWGIETDGECDLVLCRWNEDIQAFRPLAYRSSLN